MVTLNGVYIDLKRHNLSVSTFMPILGVAIYSGLAVES